MIGEMAHTMRNVNVQNDVQRVVVVRHLRRQTSEVEIVLDEALLHLTEEIISSHSDEPENPRNFVFGCRAIAAVVVIALKISLILSVRVFREFFRIFL